MGIIIPPSSLNTSQLPLQPKIEVADIFRHYGQEYRKSHTLTKKQHAVMSAIEDCRTSELGFHVDVCNECRYTERAYNSCRDRHCPKCQGITRRKWVQRQLDDLLPIPYYHAVFTLPHKLNPLISYNKEFFYELLFDSASETLLQFGHDKRWLGALIGLFGILHTWGGKLWKHVHAHFIVTGGGLSPVGTWITPKHKGKFLFPVRALSEVFRGKFIEGLKAAYSQGELIIPDTMKHLNQPNSFEKWINILVDRDWVVYKKASFATPEEAVRGLGYYTHKTVIDDNRLIQDNNEQVGIEQPGCTSTFAEKVVGYIGKYSHRVAICNDHITSIDNGMIRFKFKNYRKKGLWEETSLKADEFIRRFMMHVLPKGFHRIRHYGLLANGKRKTLIKQARELLTTGEEIKSLVQKQVIERPECPSCHKGRLITIVSVCQFGTTVFKSNLFLLNNSPLDDTS